MMATSGSIRRQHAVVRQRRVGVSRVAWFHGHVPLPWLYWLGLGLWINDKRYTHCIVVFSYWQSNTYQYKMNLPVVGLGMLFIWKELRSILWNTCNVITYPCHHIRWLAKPTKSEHLSHCYHIFPWLCVWDVCYIIFCYLWHIYSGKTGNLFSLSLCSLWWVQMVGCVLAWKSYSFICTLHLLIIIIVQTYLKTLSLSNACQIYFVECLIDIRHILAVIHYTIRGAVCFQFTHFLCDDWENIYTLSYHHHQIGSMNYYPLFKVRSWNNGVRCMSFCILMSCESNHTCLFMLTWLQIHDLITLFV